MNEKTVCESVFKQEKMDAEYFTEMMARMINSVERSRAILAKTI